MSPLLRLARVAGLVDAPRLRTYRVIAYLAASSLVLGGAAGAPGTPWTTALVYLALGLAGVALHEFVERGLGRRGAWPLAAAVDVGAQAFVIARMGGPGSPFLLLLALPIFVWGVFQGPLGGWWTAALAVAADAVLLPVWTQDRGLFSVLWFHAPGLMLLGTFAGLLGRRIQQEEALHQRTRRELVQARLDAESILAQLSRGLLCLNVEGAITHMNGQAESLLRPFGGLTVGSRLDAVPTDHPLFPLAERLARSPEGARETTQEVHLSPAEGSLLPLEVTTTAIRDAQGRAHGSVVLLGDLTEHRAREAEDRRRERLALIGELSAGLAHEIRNSLKPLTGSVELLRREIPPGGGSGDALMEIILREAESLENFLTEFLLFARDKNLQMQLLPLERVLGEELKSLNALPHGFFRWVRPETPGEPLYVQVDRAALGQVLRNLGLNAIEAASGLIEVGWEREGNDAVIFVRDHGPGIPEEIRSRVFEPFFTTKASGTGLGLAIARDLVDRLGGRLTLAPAPGGGTRAAIRLPLIPPRAQCPPGSEEAEARAA
jgi:signal transduction histidine kinase